MFVNKTVCLRSNLQLLLEDNVWLQFVLQKTSASVICFFSVSPPVCKFVSIEMKSAFEETGKTKAVIESNYNFIDGKGAPPVKYVKSWVSLSALMAVPPVLSGRVRKQKWDLHSGTGGTGSWSDSVPVEELNIERSWAAVRVMAHSKK